MKLQELFEAKVGRAWEGRLKKIDNLLAWMYDKDILNKSEKTTKDRLFRQYYRYYNDGDIPRGMKYADNIEETIEEKVEEFIKNILSKYSGKIDKTLFRYDQTLSDLKTVIDIVNRFDVYALISYWKKNVKDPEVLKLINDLSKKYEKLDSATKKAINSHEWEHSYDNPKGLILTARKEKMKKAKIWTSSFESMWKDIQKDMIEIGTLLKNIKTGIEKLKDIHNIYNETKRTK